MQLWTPYWNYNYITHFSNVAPTSPDYNHALNESSGVNTGFNSGVPGTTVISQYILGTFTADSSVQNIYYYGEDATVYGGYGMIGAIQVRTVPEPTTVALLAVSGLVLVVRSRIRQRKLTA